MERYTQSETYYPTYQEGFASDATGVDLSILRCADGFWYDFIASAFQDAYDADSLTAMTEDANGTNGLWGIEAGWAIPDANGHYQVRFKVTDGTGAFYKEGPKIVVDDTVQTTVVDLLDSMRAEPLTDAETLETIGGMIHAIYCKLMQKLTVTTSKETVYKLDDSTELRAHDLSDDDTTVTRTGG